MKSVRTRFPGASGNQLAARIEWPDEAPRAFVLFAHCFSCSKDLKAVHRISRSLAAEGLAVVRFDFTGLGESEGDFAETNFSSNLADLRAAIEYLRDEHEAPSLLVGHSLGGAAVLAVAGDYDEVKAVATIAAPSDTKHLRESLSTQAPDLASGKADETEIKLGGRPFRIRRQLLEDLGDHNVPDRVHKLGRPLLIFHGPFDDVVEIDHARRIYEAALHPKSFVSLDTADHLLTKGRDATYVARVLASWAARYLDLGGDADAGTSGAERAIPDQKPGAVVVRGGAEGFLQHVVAGRHRWLADEPKRVGGTDLGPTPYDFLLAALGTCTSMTLRMYADRKKWPLEGVEVSLEHARIHAKDCADCETEKGQVDEIKRTLRILGDQLDEEQVARLMEIADRCPVHRTLENEIKIRSTLAAPNETATDDEGV